MAATDAEEFVLRLNQQISGPASAAENALAKLEAQIRKEQAALTGLESKLSSAYAELSKAESAAVKDPKAIAAAREKVASAQEEIDKRKKGLATLGKAEEEFRKKAAAGKADREAKAAAKATEKAQRDAAKAAKEKAEAMKNAQGAATSLGGPLGNLISKGSALKEVFGKAGAAGAVLAIAAALVILVAAAAAAFIALATFAAKTADAARSAAILNEAAAGSAAGGAELGAVVDDLSTRVDVAKGKLLEMARGLEVAGLRGRDMQLALSAAGTVAATMGDAAGAKIKAMAEESLKARRLMLGAYDFRTGQFANLVGTGVSTLDVAGALAKRLKTSIPHVIAMMRANKIAYRDGIEALEEAVNTKLGPLAARQMLSFDAQAKKMKENLAALFADVKIEPFLKGLKTITDLFSQNTYTGHALKYVLTGVFNSVFAAASKVFPVVRAFFLGMIIGALWLYLGIKKVGKAITDSFGGESKKSIDWVKTGMWLGVAAVLAMAAAAFALVAVIGILIASFTALAIITMPLWLPMLLMVAGVMLAIYGVVKAVQALSSAFDGLKSINLGEAAQNIIHSLVNGIMAKIGAVKDAMASVGAAIKGALPAALDMHSPSVILTEQAEMAAYSVVRPLEDAAPEAHSAMSNLGGGRPDFGSAAGGGRASVSIGQLVYNGSRSDFPDFEAKVLDLFERAANGVSPTPEGAT